MTRKLHQQAHAAAQRDAGARRSGSAFQWDILDDGNDARFRTGKHAGMTITDLMVTDTGKEYLSWVYRVAPEELRDIIEGFFSQ